MIARRESISNGMNDGSVSSRRHGSAILSGVAGIGRTWTALRYGQVGARGGRIVQKTVNKMRVVVFLSLTLAVPFAASRPALTAQEVRMWRTFEFQRKRGSNEPERNGNKSMEPVYSLAFSYDGKMIASITVNELKLWDVATGKSIASLGDGPFRCVAFSPNAKTVATGGGRIGPGEVLLWDVASGKKKAELKGHEQTVTSVAFAPDGRIFATGADDGTVRVWETASLKSIATLRHGGNIACVAFAPNGRRLASSNGTGTIALWDTTTWKQILTISVPVSRTPGVHAMGFSPDATTLVSGDNDMCVILWNVATGRMRSMLGFHLAPVTSVAFSPNGKTVASLGVVGTLQLWDVPSGRKIAAVEHPPGHGFSDAVAFSPDGSLLATGCYGAVGIWRVSIPDQRDTQTNKADKTAPQNNSPSNARVSPPSPASPSK